MEPELPVLVLEAGNAADKVCGMSFADHDAYIAAAPEEMQPLLAQVRTELARVLPDAEEIISYNMPGFQIGDAMIVGYAAFTKQCGIYVSAGAITDNAGAIAAAGLKATKTGVTFSPRKPISNELIESLALASRGELGV